MTANYSKGGKGEEEGIRSYDGNQSVPQQPTAVPVWPDGKVRFLAV